MENEQKSLEVELAFVMLLCLGENRWIQWSVRILKFCSFSRFFFFSLEIFNLLPLVEGYCESVLGHWPPAPPNLCIPVPN